MLATARLFFPGGRGRVLAAQAFSQAIPSLSASSRLLYSSPACRAPCCLKFVTGVPLGTKCPTTDGAVRSSDPAGLARQEHQASRR